MAVGRCANPRVNGADRPVLQVAVTVGGAEIPGSPFKVMSDEPVHAKAGGHVGAHAAAEPSGTRRKEPDVHVTIAPTVVHWAWGETVSNVLWDCPPNPALVDCPVGHWGPQCTPCPACGTISRSMAPLRHNMAHAAVLSRTRGTVCYSIVLRAAWLSLQA